MSYVGRLCALLILIVLLVVPAYRTWAAGSRSAVHLSAAQCQNTQLSVQATQSRGAAGTIRILFRIHRTWGASCTLQGYPGAEFLDRQFHSLPTHVSRASGMSEPQVTLAPGHDAYFTLQYSDVPTGNEACPRVPYLMVTPPNLRLPIVTYTYGGKSQAYVTPCGGNVTVSSVRASATFE